MKGQSLRATLKGKNLLSKGVKNLSFKSSPI